MKFAVLIIGLLLSRSAIATAAESYPRPELLMEPDQLAIPEVAKHYVVLDARSPQQYEQGHIPAARWVDPMVWAKEFASGTDNVGWSKRIGTLGINAESQVIIYDDGSAKDAARIWWILRYWGVKNARLLNGGWPSWMSGQFPVESKPASPVPPVAFEAKADSRRLATKKQILGLLNDKEFQIVDARSEKEFCGIEKLTNKRAGSIPGAKQLEWSQLLDPQTKKFKSPEALRKVFQESGVHLHQRTATHCQSGGRASVMAFGLELMGAEDVSNYYSSWAEWGNADDTPVVTGTPKK